MAVNLPFEYVRKSLNYDASGSPSELVVYLNVNGQETPFFLSTEHEKKTNTELFDLVMESIYQVNFPMRAENEKFNLLGTKIAEVDKATEESKKATEDLIAQTEKTKQELQDKIDNAVVELTTLITSSLSGTA
ncbi:DUF1366 domain-containing protein [Streptococcus uberis]|uniref:DUF1366 domain-containing protein n=1 Tax=Streptococcus uberis TaxID=1349 RepID=UPI0005431E70|nr:DUF1366 domain-containing protein [Streptococcus uberis]KHD40306.1 hypothetical protein NA32_06630 [Streptococcus hongkongensis]SQG45487.1 Protein of uncharacterised function (DUF1366) [Streptococcus uberis]